jgi:hypothetical protein
MANEEEIKNNTNNEDTKKTKTDRIARGNRPPKISLGDAVQIAMDLNDKAGGEATLDELSDIMNNSRGSSTFVIKLGLVKNFDLVTQEDGKVRLSPIGDSVANPKDPSERSEALKKAFLHLDVFKTIYDKFVGKILPQDEFLKNSFAEKVGKELAEKWMEKFKESAIYAGLLTERSDGKLQVRESAKSNDGNSNDGNSNDAEVVNKQSTETVYIEPSRIKQEIIPVKTDYFAMLIEIMDAKAMTDDEQKAVWTLITYLKKKEAGIHNNGEN